MKRGKEIKLNLPYNYNVVSGTVDNKNPESIYIQISAWGKPKNKEEENFELIIKQKSKSVKRKLFEVLDFEQFLPKTIVDFNMASSGISYDKRSFMSVEVTLFQKIGILRIRVIDVGISGYSVTLINGTNHRIINDRMEKHGSLFVFISK